MIIISFVGCKMEDNGVVPSNNNYFCSATFEIVASDLEIIVLKGFGTDHSWLFSDV